MPVSAEGRVENQNEPKRPPLCRRLGFGFQLSSLENEWCRLYSVPVYAEGRVENQNEPKRPPLCGRLGSFGFQLDSLEKYSGLRGKPCRVPDRAL